MVFRNFTYKINIIKDDTLAKAMLKNVTVAMHVVATHHGASDKVFFTVIVQYTPTSILTALF